MEIIIDNVLYNITAEDLETAKERFTFWEGRRFSICGTDLKEHFLRYNDIVQGIVAEDAIFEEDEDKQRIYTALNILKDQGYPYTGPWEICTNIMLCFKQLFGNFFRQDLLDQLKNKLYVESDEPSALEETSEEQETLTLISPVLNIHNVPEDILVNYFKYMDRTEIFQVASTCKLFQNVIQKNKPLNIHRRNFSLLKQVFALSQSFYVDANYGYQIIESRSMIDIESQYILLLAEIKPKQVIAINPKQGTGINPSIRIYSEDLIYAKHQQKLAIALIKIDAKSAQKIITSIDKVRYPIQAFCSAAALYKNSPSILCSEVTILEMGKAAQDRMHGHRGKERFKMLMELFEAYLGLDNQLASHLLDEIGSYLSAYHRGKDVGYYTQHAAKMIKRIGIDQFCEEEEVHKIMVELLNKLLELNFFVHCDNNDELYNMAQSLAILAKTIVLIDQAKAIEVLEMALSGIDKLSFQGRMMALATIVEAFAEFDQDRALEVIDQALKDIDYQQTWNNDLDNVFYYMYRCSLIESLNRIIKIASKTSREIGRKILKENAEKIRIMDETNFPSPTFDDNYFSLDNFPYDILMGGIELFDLSNLQGPLQMANLGVEWAKTNSKRSVFCDEELYHLSLALSKKFPEKALEVAEMISDLKFKSQTLLSIVSQGSEYQQS